MAPIIIKTDSLYSKSISQFPSPPPLPALPPLFFFLFFFLYLFVHFSIKCINCMKCITSIECIECIECTKWINVNMCIAVSVITHTLLHILAKISVFEFLHHSSTTFVNLHLKNGGIEFSQNCQVLQSADTAEWNICKFDSFNSLSFGGN